MKVMKKRFITLSLCVLASVSIASAQNSKMNSSDGGSKHEIRLSVSDGLTLTSVDILGMGLADATLGSKRTDEKASIIYGLGYRYAINRFRVGADLGFAHTSSKLALKGEKAPSIKEKELNFLILPTANFVYLKKGLVELYGSASAGVNLVRHSEEGLTEAVKEAAKKADLTTKFAYQVNPIAIRIGNDHIGGFVEGGFGYKGFVTAGLSFRF